MDRKTRIRELLKGAPDQASAPVNVCVHIHLGDLKKDPSFDIGTKKTKFSFSDSERDLKKTELSMSYPDIEPQKKSLSLLPGVAANTDFPGTSASPASAKLRPAGPELKNASERLFEVMQLESSKTTRRAAA